jgi:hypothetical protein
MKTFVDAMADCTHHGDNKQVKNTDQLRAQLRYAMGLDASDLVDDFVHFYWSFKQVIHSVWVGGVCRFFFCRARFLHLHCGLLSLLPAIFSLSHSLLAWLLFFLAIFLTQPRVVSLPDRSAALVFESQLWARLLAQLAHAFGKRVQSLV